MSSQTPSAAGSRGQRGGTGMRAIGRGWLMALAWLWVGVPFAYGVYELIRQVIKLFGG